MKNVPFVRQQLISDMVLCTHILDFDALQGCGNSLSIWVGVESIHKVQLNTWSNVCIYLLGHSYHSLIFMILYSLYRNLSIYVLYRIIIWHLAGFQLFLLGDHMTFILKIW